MMLTPRIEPRESAWTPGLRKLARLILCLVLVAAGWGEAQAQLAITEVLSQGTTNCGANPTNSLVGPDFWELTNFGTNTINLNGYKWMDRDRRWPDGLTGLIFTQPTILTIEPGESIIFVRSGNALVGDEFAFREWWWGDPFVHPELKVRFWEQGIGLDDSVDAVILADPQNNLVDRVDLGRATIGVTFISDPLTGDFGRLSEIGAGWAFKAVCPEDIGSPGTDAGPVPMFLREQPTNQTVRAGTWTTLRVRAGGLPRPHYQWYFNDSPIPGANTADFTIPLVLESHAGRYFVELSNGREHFVTEPATLTVDPSPYRSEIVCLPQDCCVPSGDTCPPLDLSVTPGQTARFEVFFWGYPIPTSQWYSNGVALPNQTNRTLVIHNTDYGSAGNYCVVVSNSLGRASACATLAVKREPRLRITEAMNVACGSADRDWWELTNLDTDPVNLCGYRWDDRTNAIGGGPTITNTVIVQPGESVILVERQSREQFIAWWGESNLPPNLQVITYFANGLGDTGDDIAVWNVTATDDLDYLDRVGFSTANVGVSRWFDKTVCAEYGVFSVEGQCGAFRAAQTCDVGSPGWTQWTPPRLVSLSREPSGVKLTWKAPPGSTNLLQYKRHPEDADWITLGSFTALEAVRTATDPTLGADHQRFYRIVSMPHCSCCRDEDCDTYPPQENASVVWPPQPRLTFIRWELAGVTVTSTAEPGSAYVLQCQTDVTGGGWTSLGTNVATSTAVTFTDTTSGSQTQRFYRVISPPNSP
jgi:hypothetical protein